MRRRSWRSIAGYSRCSNKRTRNSVTRTTCSTRACSRSSTICCRRRTCTGPVKLVQPSVVHKFADPKLESLSAGQKLLIRMGPRERRRHQSQAARDPGRVVLTDGRARTGDSRSRRLCHDGSRTTYYFSMSSSSTSNISAAPPGNRALAVVAVGRIGRATELGLAADLHLLHAFGPARESRRSAERRSARRAARSCRTRCRRAACRDSSLSRCCSAVGIAPVPSLPGI